MWGRVAACSRFPNRFLPELVRHSASSARERTRRGEGDEHMSKELVISANRHETKVALIEDDQLVEVYFQRSNEYSLAGSIHKGRVTRVLPGMQSAFVDVGLERDTFLYVSDFLEEHDDFDKITGDERPVRESRDRDRDRGRDRGRDRAPREPREARPPAQAAPEAEASTAPAETPAGEASPVSAVT